MENKGSWEPKNWCFWTVCWRRLLRVPWTARSNQSILREISPNYSLEGLMLKLKLQYFGHLMRRIDSLEKTLILGFKAGGEGDKREWGGWIASLTQWTWVWANSELVMDTEAWRATAHGLTKSRTWLSDLTQVIWPSHNHHWAFKKCFAKTLQRVWVF